MTAPKDPVKFAAWQEKERERSRQKSARARAEVKALKNSLAGTTDLPEGHRLKGASVLTDETGKLRERWDKTERESTPEGEQPAVPDTFAVKKQSRYTDAQGNVRGMWTSYDQPTADRLALLERAAESFAARFAGLGGTAPIVRLNNPGAKLLNVFPLGDPHVGMLAWAPASGENFDLKIASATLRAVVDQLVSEAPSAREALLVNVGDFFHADDNSQLTPGHGNKLDVEGRAEKVFDLGVELCVWMITRLLEKHETVRMFNAPGNHDPATSRFLRATLKAWFRNEPRVIIESNLNPFQYYKFGKTLFGITHGDNCKPAELPEIMAADARALWGETEWHLWLTGHVHHDQVKDYRDCQVMTFCTLAARDYWHNWRGYRARRRLQRLTFHEDTGLSGSGHVDLYNLSEHSA
jgi:hypothetical protein